MSVHVILPVRFHTEEMIRYHRRDPLEASELWADEALHKGLSWRGRPARLRLRFADGRVAASLDAAAAPLDTEITALVRRMLGLDQDIDGFERFAASHPTMGPLVERQSGLRVPVAATPFEALCWAIIGQQISVKAAVAIRRRFIQAAGLRHASGLWCHPDAEAVLRVPDDILRQAGLSASKARSIRAIACGVADGSLPLDGWLDSLPVAQVRERLLAIPGIGPWTADYTLLRGYGWLDGSLHGDVAVRRALQTLTGSDGASPGYTQGWLAQFSPWRALAAAHLWASRALQA